MRELWEGMVWFNVRYLSTDAGLARRLERIGAHLNLYFCGSLGVWGLGAAAVYSARRVFGDNGSLRREWAVVAAALAGPIVWTTIDYQSYPDLYPFVPFVAIGVALLADQVLRAMSGGAALALGAAFLAALVGAAMPALRSGLGRGCTLFDQRKLARQAMILAGREGALVSIGAPQVMALTGWPNPARYGFIVRGIDDYVQATEPGGFEGWVRRVLVDRPTAAVLLGRNHGDRVEVLQRIVQDHYVPVATAGDAVLYVRRRAGDRRRQQRN